MGLKWRSPAQFAVNGSDYRSRMLGTAGSSVSCRAGNDNQSIFSTHEKVLVDQVSH